MNIITKAVLDMETMQWVSIESYDYEGAVELCCGPSGSEKYAESQSANLSSQLSSDFSSRFADQSGLISQLQSSLSPIVAGGPSAEGFSPQELSALNSGAINRAGAAYKNAAQATAGALAGRGGDSGLTSGVDAQLKAGIASSAAGQGANALNQIQQADFATGRDNYFRAAGGLQTLANSENPEVFGSEATSSNANTFKEADTVSNEENQKEQAIAGAITGIGGSILSGGLTGLAGSAAGASQPLAFLTGALSGGKG